jgi:hypothetical protein
MANTNCLEGKACPKCGQEDRLMITGLTTFEVTDDGTGDHGDVEWDDDSPCSCPSCGHAGKLKDFEVSP